MRKPWFHHLEEAEIALIEDRISSDTVIVAGEEYSRNALWKHIETTTNQNVLNAYAAYKHAHSAARQNFVDNSVVGLVLQTSAIVAALKEFGKNLAALGGRSATKKLATELINMTVAMI